MHITFHGAARIVTGSKHLLEVDGLRILLDCGMFQGHDEEIRALNTKLPVHPGSLDYIVLSHAHIDHSGLIPYFIKQGFKGKIICTLATKDLVGIMLEDSGKIQEHDADFLNDKIERHHLNKEKVTPLYDALDAKNSEKYFLGINYNSTFDLSKNVTVTFQDAGHILGSSIVVIEDKEHGKKLVFTGDLGRKGLPILKDPVQITDANYLITESTYGNRVHETVEGMEESIKKVVTETIARGGKVIIPSFSVGRTQEIVYLLHLLWEKKQIPVVPIYVDSPLSQKATEVFQRHPECYDSETYEEFLLDSVNPFGFQSLTYVSEVRDSIAINELHTPAIIISSSGMCENGRILHHLKKTLPDPRNTILIVGYQAQGTLGRRLVDGAGEVFIHGKMRRVEADVVVLNSFSAHADMDELFSFATHIKGLEKVFLVHGEEDQSLPFAERLRSEGQIKEVYVPHLGEGFEV